MNILNNLERRFGRYAIPQLIVYIVGINALVYMLRYYATHKGTFARISPSADVQPGQVIDAILAVIS